MRPADRSGGREGVRLQTRIVVEERAMTEKRDATLTLP
jgi:hypothetical protein